MSQQNVEVVREVIALMNAAAANEPDELDPRLLDLFADDAQIDMSRRIRNPDIYQGHAGLHRLRREVNEVWEGFLESPERIMDAGESVMVIETQLRPGRVGAAEVEHRTAVIWTVRNGQVIRMEVGLDAQEALELVRLREFL
jgi:ketosteroid isomerase-like protein